MGMMSKISAADAKLNMMFSAPVFFDDGKNMFLAPHQTAKKYHIKALTRWRVPFLVTAGHQELKSQVQNESPAAELETVEDFLDVEEIEEVEEL